MYGTVYWLSGYTPQQHYHSCTVGERVKVICLHNNQPKTCNTTAPARLEELNVFHVDGMSVIRSQDTNT